MNPTLLSPDQKRTILAKEFQGVIRLDQDGRWFFFNALGWHQTYLNDPLLDANAAQAMEGTLTEAQLPHYMHFLDRSVSKAATDADWSPRNSKTYTECATPTQRFDAFLSSLSEE